MTTTQFPSFFPGICLPEIPYVLCLSLILRFFDDRESAVFAYFIIKETELTEFFGIRMKTLMVNKIYMVKDYVVMYMPAVKMRSNDIFVFSAGKTVGEFPSYRMSSSSIHLAFCNGLDQIEKDRRIGRIEKVLDLMDMGWIWAYNKFDIDSL